MIISLGSLYGFPDDLNSAFWYDTFVMKRWLYSERVWILGSTILLLLLSYVPIVRTFSETPQELWYWGAEEYPLDLTGNLSTVRQGYNGHWLATLNYSSTTPIPRSLVKIEYIIIGQIARVFHADPTVMFFVVRGILSLVYLSVIYTIIGSLFTRKRDRIIAWILILFSGSIMRPGDYHGFFYTAAIETLVTYRLLLAMPHYLIGNICGLLSLVYLVKTMEHPNNVRTFILSVVAGAISSLTYAPTMVLILLTIPLYVLVWFIREKMSKTGDVRIPCPLGVLFAYVSFVIIPILYVKWVTAYVWEGFRAISHIEKLNPFTLLPGEYLLDVGVVYVLAFIALPEILKSKNTLSIFLFFWIIIHPVAIFFISGLLDLNTIRFFLTPYIVVFGILAVYGIQRITVLVPVRWKTTLTIGLAVITLLAGAVSYQANYNRTHLCFCMQPYHTYAYPTKSVMNAIFWLRDHTKEDDTVLSLYYAGNLIPAFAGNCVYISWWYRLAELPNVYSMETSVADFYKGDVPVETAKKFIDTNHISYVFWGEEERAQAPIATILPYPFLKDVYNTAGTVIYRVVE
jgi:hypothetical protein